MEACHGALHEVGKLPVGALGLAFECLGGPDALSPQHRSQAEPFEERRGHDPDRAAAEVGSLVVLPSGLGDVHEARLLQLSDGPFAAALAQPGILDDGLHVDVDEAIAARRHAKAQ